MSPITFDIKITDPCRTIPTTFDGPPNEGTCSNIVATVLGPTVTKTVNLNNWTDVISGSRGSIRDGYTLCSASGKTFILTPTASNNGGLIALASHAWGTEDPSGAPTYKYSATPTLMSEIGVYDYDCHVRITLSDGSTVDSSTQQVKVRIKTCATAADPHPIVAGTYAD